MDARGLPVLGAGGGNREAPPFFPTLSRTGVTETGAAVCLPGKIRLDSAFAIVPKAMFPHICCTC